MVVFEREVCPASAVLLLGALIGKGDAARVRRRYGARCVACRAGTAASAQLVDVEGTACEVAAIAREHRRACQAAERDPPREGVYERAGATVGRDVVKALGSFLERGEQVVQAPASDLKPNVPKPTNAAVYSMPLFGAGGVAAPGPAAVDMLTPRPLEREGEGDDCVGVADEVRGPRPRKWGSFSNPNSLTLCDIESKLSSFRPESGGGARGRRGHDASGISWQGGKAGGQSAAGAAHCS